MNRKEKKAFRTVAALLGPLIFYELCMEVAAWGCAMTGRQNGLLMTGAGAVLALPFLLAVYFKKTQWDRKPDKRFVSGCFFCALAGAGACFCLNALLQMVFPPSKGWESAREMIYQVPCGVRVAITVLLTPLTEEVLFRGLLRIELKKLGKPIPAAFAGALIFGVYHGNLTQGVYAFFLGLCLELVCAWSGSLLPAICLHAGANAASAIGSFKRFHPAFFAAFGTWLLVVSSYKIKEVFEKT